MINKDSINGAVKLLTQTAFDGSKTNMFARYNASKLLERWVKHLRTFASIHNNDVPESFYSYLQDIISGYNAIVQKEMNSDNYQIYLHLNKKG